MKLPHRRQFLHLAAGAAALPAVTRFVWAQAYPARPVRIVVGFPAWGQIDIIARLMGQWLSDRLGLAIRHRQPAWCRPPPRTTPIISAPAVLMCAFIGTAPIACSGPRTCDSRWVCGETPTN
jgi:hypothetical protein